MQKNFRHAFSTAGQGDFYHRNPNNPPLLSAYSLSGSPLPLIFPETHSELFFKQYGKIPRTQMLQQNGLRLPTLISEQKELLNCLEDHSKMLEKWI